MTTYAMLVAIGYLLGSIPFSFIASKVIGDIDIRKHGSGNSGATNVFRTLGKKAGALAFLGDFAKGLVAAVIGRYIMGVEGALLCSTMAVIGHCYPFTIGFKGGKGVATTAGMIVGVDPLIAVILIVIQFGIIFTTRYMSLASILSAALFPVVSYFMGRSMTFVGYAAFLGLFVVFRHRANLMRLLNGTENKLKLKKK